MDDIKNKTSDYLANERTFLAWLRTAVALMGFGLILVKFSVFLKQVMLIDAKNLIRHPERDYSGVTGLVLLASGLVILTLSYFNYRLTQKKIRSNAFTGSNSLILIVTLLMIAVGVFLIIYLFLSI